MTPEPNTSAQRVEAYLDQILLPLGHNLSGFHREELRRELKAHLWERVDAYRELGCSENDAVTEALRQFGGAEDFTRQWRVEWLALDRQGAGRELGAATWSALRLSVPMLLASWGLARLLVWLVINCLPTTYLGALGIVYGNRLLAVGGAGFFHLSLWSGLVHGRRTPKRGGTGMFAALGTVITLGTALYWVSEKTGLDRTVLGGLFTSLQLMAAAWLPTACLSAAVTGWRARQAQTRHLT